MSFDQTTSSSSKHQWIKGIILVALAVAGALFVSLAVPAIARYTTVTAATTALEQALDELPNKNANDHIYPSCTRPHYGSYTLDTARPVKIIDPYTQDNDTTITAVLFEGTLNVNTYLKKDFTATMVSQKNNQFKLSRIEVK